MPRFTFRVLILCVLELLLSACTPVISPQLMDQVDRDLTYSLMASRPDEFKGKIVLLGGSIVQTVPKPKETEIEVVQKQLSSDVDQTIADTFQMEVMLNNTIKPIIAVSYDLPGMFDAVEMAEVVMGGAYALRQHPNFCGYINVATGLNHNSEALQKLLYLSAKGLPSLYIPSTTAGTSSPITPAGAVALDNAGVLLGLVLSQLNREGAPYIMPGMPPAPMDMRTMSAPYAYPVRGIFQAMAKMYKLPAFGAGGMTDAKVLDQQAAAEAKATGLAAVAHPVARCPVKPARPKPCRRFVQLR